MYALYLPTVGLCQRPSHSVGSGVARTSGAVCEHDILDDRGARGHQTGAQRPEGLPQEAAESGELWMMCVLYTDVHLVIMWDMLQSCIRGCNNSYIRTYMYAFLLTYVYVFVSVYLHKHIRTYYLSYVYCVCVHTYI